MDNMGKAFIYDVARNAKKGTTVVFLNPVGSDPQGIRYLLDYYKQTHETLDYTLILSITQSDYFGFFTSDEFASYRLVNLNFKIQGNTNFKIQDEPPK